MTEQIKSIRNVALAGHGGSGKTSLAEAILFNAGLLDRHGKVEEGNTTMDFQPEEINKQQSINTSFFNLTHNKFSITLLDTPGDQNFFSAAKTCIPAADCVALLVDGVSGPSAMTEAASQCADEYNLPTLLFINKLDRERADFHTALEATATSLDKKVLVTQLPIGLEAEFSGIVDIISGKAFKYSDGKVEKIDIPSDMKDDVEVAKEEFIENVAELDDELLERYLEGEEITQDELKKAFRNGVLERAFYPALCGAATQSIGVELFLDFINDYMPSPEDRGAWIATDNDDNEIEVLPDPDREFTGFVFNTIVDPYAGRLSIFRVVSGQLGKDGNLINVNKDNKERFSQLLEIAGKKQNNITSAIPGSIVAVSKLKNTLTGDTITASENIKFPAVKPLPAVISFSISPKTKGDEDKIHEAIRKILEEDPGLQLKREEETNETLLSGTGLVHIETTCEKVKRKFNVEVAIATPKVPYKETIKKKIRVQGKHKKQSGGHGQFGDCWINFEPLPKGKGFEFVNKIVGGSIPKNYIPAVEAGVKESAQRGFLAGFPCIDFRATVDDGSYHAVDSSEMAFKMAGSLAFKAAIAQAKAVILEPILKVSVIVPDEYTGDIMGDFNSRRGKVLGMDSEGTKQVVNALVPMSEMLRYAPDLNSMTGGRGTFSTEFETYEELPHDMSQKVIEKTNAEKENS
jgi:elongation factor G